MSKDKDYLEQMSQREALIYEDHRRSARLRLAERIEDTADLSLLLDALGLR